MMSLGRPGVFPGRFDIFGHSHQWWHLSVSAAALCVHVWSTQFWLWPQCCRLTLVCACLRSSYWWHTLVIYTDYVKAHPCEA